MNEKQQKPVTLLTVTGLFAAIITLMTAYICHIPYGANGGYIHFGDALIYVAAVILQDHMRWLPLRSAEDLQTF